MIAYVVVTAYVYGKNHCIALEYWSCIIVSPLVSHTFLRAVDINNSLINVIDHAVVSFGVEYMEMYYNHSQNIMKHLLKA